MWDLLSGLKIVKKDEVIYIKSRVSVRIYDDEAKIFEKKITTEGSLENKAAAGNKQHGIYTIDVDDDLDSRGY